ncbi:hypothetical protein [Dactylosporangium sp. NPDC051484]|uniref:hypothetical protein n=1 Tax=Dactylosporangium sp. NPDC051484 TaxID=3154942 RepID=UPI00344C1C18
MSWWWRARALTAVAVTLVASIAVSIAVHGAALPMPNIVGGVLVPVVFAYLLPLAPIVTVWYGVDRSRGHLDRIGVRDTSLLDLAVLAVALAVTAVVVAATWSTDLWPLGIGFLRNLIGCAGLALLVAPFIGTRLATVVPVSAVIISALLGTGLGGRAQWWAWPTAEARSWAHFAEAVAVLLAGVVVARWHRSHVPRRIGWWLPVRS